MEELNNLHDQVSFLLGQLRAGSVDIHQFMQLLDMSYQDYLEFHPEERPGLYERNEIERIVNQKIKRT